MQKKPFFVLVSRLLSTIILIISIVTLLAYSIVVLYGQHKANQLIINASEAVISSSESNVQESVSKITYLEAAQDVYSESGAMRCKCRFVSRCCTAK